MAKEPNRVGGELKRIDGYPDHRSKIGLVITDFASLEQRLCLTLWELIGDPSRADAVFWSLGSAKARCDVVRGVANEVLVGTDTMHRLKLELVVCVKLFLTAAGKRNDLAHGQWGVPTTGGTDPFVSIKRPATRSPVFERKYTITQLQAIADEICFAEQRTGLLNGALGYFLRPDIWKSHTDKMRAEFPTHDAYFRKYE